MNALAEDLRTIDTPRNQLDSGGSALAEALADEARILEDLIGVLLRQRDGVAQDDLSVVDETIYGAQRIFRTLAEARRRRRGLLRAVVGSQDIPLQELEASLGPRMTPPLREAIKTLVEMANKLATELEVNRRVLNGAIRSGEELIMALCGKKPGVSSYGPSPALNAQPTESGIIINRQI